MEKSRLCLVALEHWHNALAASLLRVVYSKEDGVDRQTLNAETRVCTPIEDILELKENRERKMERGREGQRERERERVAVVLLIRMMKERVNRHTTPYTSTLVG